jgi:hypothetical protein
MFPAAAPALRVLALGVVLGARFLHAQGFGRLDQLATDEMPCIRLRDRFAKTRAPSTAAPIRSASVRRPALSEKIRISAQP